MTDRTQTTFRDIERQFGITDELHEPHESLEVWYESVRDTPIADFSVEDICKACRQKLHPDHIVPEAIQRLKDDPMAGEKYDGELLVALGSVSRNYWMKYVEQAHMLREIVSGLDMTDAELASDIVQLMTRLQ